MVQIMKEIVNICEYKVDNTVINVNFVCMKNAEYYKVTTSGNNMKYPTKP